MIDEFNADGIAIYIQESPEWRESGNTREKESNVLSVNAINHIAVPSDIEMKDVVEGCVALAQRLGPAALLVCHVRARIAGEVWPPDRPGVDICKSKAQHPTPAAGGLSKSNVDFFVDGDGTAAEADGFAKTVSPLGYGVVIQQDDIVSMDLVEFDW